MKQAPRGAVNQGGDGVTTWEASCLNILRGAGARVTPVGQHGAGGFWVELPEEIACRQWGTPYRPHPPFHIAFAEPAGGADGEEVEVVAPTSRRAADIVDLALDRGWVGVFHEVPDGRLPALWLLIEASFDGWPLHRLQPAPDGSPSAGSSPRPSGLWSRWLVGWADLGAATEASGCRVGVLPVDPAAASGRRPRLAVTPGPCPGGRGRRPHGRLWRLPDVLQRVADAAAACFEDAILSDRPSPSPATPPFPREGGGGSVAAHPARLQLFVTMVAVVFVRPRRPWPPPALLAVGRPSR